MRFTFIRRHLPLAVLSATVLPALLPGGFAHPTVRQADRAIDPVCNIAVRRDPRLSYEYEGDTYYFCMNADLEAFKADPRKFLGADEHRHPEPADRLQAREPGLPVSAD
jgi:YHS domain-containing protein